MINAQIIDTHLASAALQHPMSKPNARDTVKTTVDGDKAYIGTQRLPPNKPLPSTETTPAVGSGEDHFDLPKYLAYLEAQREKIEVHAKQK